MSEKKELSAESLNRAIREVRNDALDPDTVREAAERVWSQIEGNEENRREIRSCHDFQSLIPALAGGRLPEARKLLLEQHLLECSVCREVVEKQKSDRVVQAEFQPQTDRASLWMKWSAIAAGLLLAFGLFQTGYFNQILPWDPPSVAVLQGLDGQVFQVMEEATSPLSAGDEIRARQAVRTGKNAGAVIELEDGSEIEVAERTELEIQGGWFGTTIRLKRGSVIVQAVEQKSGHLYVSTDDCRVAVKGTVFSVSHGMKGSRVSVIEGEVLVEKGLQNTTLLSGEQFSSQGRLSKVTVQEDIAWSRNLEEYLALLQEFSAVQKDLHEASFGEELRYSSNLLPLLPEGTIVFGAFPNISGQLGDVYNQFLQRVQENAALRSWYEERFAAGNRAVTLDEIVDRMTVFGEYVGDEVVLAIVSQPQGGQAPVLLAEVVDAAAARTLAVEEAEHWNSMAGQQVISVIDEPNATAASSGLFVLLENDLIACSTSRTLLQYVVAREPVDSFALSRFYQVIERSYSEGVDWLFSVDLATLAALKQTGEEENPVPGELRDLGVAELGELVVQRKRNESGIAENRAVLTYDGIEGGGILSLIADPGPIGGLEFVSPEAYLAAACVIDDPVHLLERVFGYLEAVDAEGLNALEQFESEHGIDIFADIAAPLGGEVVFALDGPVLPEFSWKIIVEVYDPQTLQATIEHLVGEFNGMVAGEGVSGLELMRDDTGGNTVYSLRKLDSAWALEYSYAKGYMIIATNRSLIHTARQGQEARYTLANSSDFLEALPRDTSVDLSAVFYQNLGPMMEVLISNPVGQSLANVSPESRETAQDLVGTTTPMLITLRSEPGQLTLASGGDIESFWFNLGTIVTLGGPEGIVNMLEEGVRLQ